MNKVLIILFFSFIVFYGCKDNSTNPVVNQQNMKLINTYNTYASTNGVYLAAFNFRNYAFIADGSAGMQILDVTLVNTIDSVSSYDTDGSANDICVAGINGDTYAFISDYNGGYVIVDIDDPASPFLLGTIAAAGFVNTSYVDAVNRIAYVAFATGQVSIYDLSPLPNIPTFLGSISIPGGSANGLSVSGDKLYIAGGNVGIEIVNIANPQNPIVLSAFNTPGNASGITVSTNFAYVADASNGMLVLNVSNPSAPVQLSRFAPNGQILGVAVNNNNVFTADNGYGVENVSVSTPQSPTQQGYIQTNSSALNIVYFGGYIYLAAAEGGMAIFQPTN
ncbi:MAG: hypothetical protein K8I03_03890 [Ignavibacteria bacterium]|nr:hypothetical protein [Ignavibacteria bacterium]